MKSVFNPTVIRIVVITAILLAVIVSIINPSFSDPIKFYIKFIVGSLIGLALLGIVVLGLMIWIGELSQTNAEKKRPHFFEEMQSALRTVLLPLGFEEREEAGRFRYVEYSRETFSMRLTLDIMDKIYYATASSKSEITDDQKILIPDFTVECVDLRKMDKFKSETIAKLNEWLVKKRLG